MAHALEMRFDSNHLARSDDPSNAVWVKTNVTATTSLADPVGGTSAWSLTAGNVANADNAYQEWTTNASAVRYSCEFYCRAGDADAESNTLSFGFYDQTATSWPNQTTRILSGPGSMEDTTGSQRIGSLDTATWTRVQVNLDAAATATNTLRFYFYPGGDDATSDAEVDIYRPTIQEYPHDSRLVSTTTAVTTTWTDVVADVLMRIPVRVSRGIFGSSPTDLVARPGTMVFGLNNHASNSGSLAGYYSPGHANVRSGFKHGIKVRLKIDAGGGVTRYVFNGRITSIIPSPGSTGSGETLCIATDWLGEIASLSGFDLALAEDQTSDQLVVDVVDLVASPPAITDYDTGLDTLPFAFDDLAGETSAISVIQAICQSGLDRLYLRGDTTHGETLTFENRHARLLASSAATLTESDFRYGSDSFLVPNAIERVFNDIEVEVVPREVDTGASTVLVSFDSSIEVGPSLTETRWADYTDPNNEAEFVGGKNIVTPVASTDYTAWANDDGSGVNFTSSVTIVATSYGSRVRLDITNSETEDTVYVKGPGTDPPAPGMQVRGDGLYRYAPILIRESDAQSIDTYSRRQLSSPIRMRYQDDQNIGRGIAQQILGMYKDVDTVPTRVALNTGDVAILQSYLPRDIGDIVTISETQTGVSSKECVIHAVEYEIRDGVVLIWWTLAEHDSTSYFVLDDATLGKLDTGGVLGYA